MNNNLTVETTYSYPLPLTNKQMVDGKKLLDDLDKLDELRLKTNERRNFLKNYLNEKSEWYTTKAAQNVD